MKIGHKHRFTECLVDCPLEASRNDGCNIYAPKVLVLYGVSNLGSGLILACFHARGQVYLLSKRFHTTVISYAEPKLLDWLDQLLHYFEVCKFVVVEQKLWN